MSEQFPSQEPNFEKQESQKNKWGKFKTLVLAGSLLANGGFLAEKAHEQLKVESLKDGVKQSFSVEQPDGPSNSHGERGAFSLQKVNGDHWVLVGEISRYEKDAQEKEITHIVRKVSYELPASLPPEAAEAIFDDVQKAAEQGGPDGNVNAFMGRLIESAESGSIVDYNRTTGQPMHRLAIDMRQGEQAMATETVFSAGENGESKVYSESKIPLESLGARPNFQDQK